MVDSQGNLHEKESLASTSAAEPAPVAEGLRNRKAEAAGVAIGAAAADPFGDEMGMDFSENSPELLPKPEQSKESTATLEGERLSPLAIDTSAASSHVDSYADDVLVDLTPTTSAAPSYLPVNAPYTPTSDSETLENDTPAPEQPSRFQSVHEWAEASTASFHSAPESEATSSYHDAEMTDDESMVDVSDSVSHVDVMSDASDHINTPGSWSEVGSMISESDS